MKGIVMHRYVSFVTRARHVSPKENSIDGQDFEIGLHEWKKSLSRRVSEPVSSCQG